MRFAIIYAAFFAADAMLPLMSYLRALLIAADYADSAPPRQRRYAPASFCRICATGYDADAATPLDDFRHAALSP